MVFNSLAYLFFLILTAVAYYLLPGRFRWIWLLIASVGYYLSFIPVFLPLMVSIVVINYLMAGWMEKASALNSRNSLVTIVAANVAAKLTKTPHATWFSNLHKPKQNPLNT